MATAQNIDFRSSGLQSPQAAYKLAKQEDSQKIVPIDATASRKKAMLTSSAPQLNPAQAASAATATSATAPTAPATQANPAAGQTFLSLLALYMASVILAQVDLTKNQSSILQAQTNSQNSLVTVAQAQSNKAIQQYQAYERAKEKQAHESVFHKIFGCVVAVFCCVAAAFTGGLTAFLAASIVTAFTLSGGEQALSKAIGGPAWATALGTAIVGTLVSCGIAGVCTAATDAATTAASTGAETAAAAGAENVVANAIEDEVEDEAIAAADNAATTAKPAEKSFLSKALDNGFSKATLLENGGQFFTMLNPLGDLLTMALKKMGVSEEYAEIIGQILGTLLTAGAFAGTEFYFAKSGSLSPGEDPLMNFLKTGLSQKNLFRIQTGLDLARASFQVTAASYGIQESVATMKMADVNKKIGDTQQAMTMFNGMISANQALSDEKSFSNLMHTYAEITSSFSNLIEPGRKAAEILG